MGEERVRIDKVNEVGVPERRRNFDDFCASLERMYANRNPLEGTIDTQLKSNLLATIYEFRREILEALEEEIYERGVEAGREDERENGEPQEPLRDESRD